MQVAPFTAAVLVLAKTVSASEWIVERVRSDGEMERVPARQLPAWLDGERGRTGGSRRTISRKMLSLNLNLFGNALAVATDKTWNGGWPNQMVAYPWSDATGERGRAGGGAGPGWGYRVMGAFPAAWEYFLSWRGRVSAFDFVCAGG